MCDTKQTFSVRVIVKSRSAMLNKSLVKLTCETTQLSPLLSQTQAKNQRFQMLFNPEHFKMGDFDTVMKSTTLDVFKPWNEYKLKNDKLLIFNPSKVKSADLSNAEPASTEMAQWYISVTLGIRDIRWDYLTLKTMNTRTKIKS